METQLEVNGLKLSLIDYGQGAPVLLVHGLSGYKENWEENLDYFAARHRVLALDLPGFGRSEKRTDLPYTVEFFSDLLCAMLSRCGIAKAHWIGNSMGGLIAALTALNHPDRVDRLVLVNAAGTNQRQAEALLASNQAMLSNPDFKPTPELLGMMMRTLIFHGPSPQIDKMIARALEDSAQPEAPLQRDATIKALQSILATPLTERLGEIRSPTLVVWGRNDNLVNVSNAAIFAEKIPRAELFLIDQCGHCPMLEKPADFNQRVGQFLDRD